MIIVTRRGVTEEEVDRIREKIESLGLRTHISRGETRVIIGCIGDEERLQHVPLQTLPGVETVHPVMKPYKLAAKQFTAEPTRILLGRSEVEIHPEPENALSDGDQTLDFKEFDALMEGLKPFAAATGRGMGSAS
jgi:hypothetical protein